MPPEILERMKNGFDVLQILGLYLLIEATVLDSRGESPAAPKPNLGPPYQQSRTFPSEYSGWCGSGIPGVPHSCGPIPSNGTMI